MRPKLRAWLQLMRVPNLFTVPGDPLAGACIAAACGAAVYAGPVGCAVLAALLLYIAGLLSNDYFDLELDRRERPARPLPRGAVSPWAALAASVVCGAGGVAAAFCAGRRPGAVALALAGAIAVYNLGGKRIPVWGPLNMGLCRGLSLAMGAAVAAPLAGRSPVAIAALGVLAYIAAVTAIAARETESGPLGRVRWLPLGAVVSLFAAFFLLAAVEGGFALVFFPVLPLLSTYVVWRCAHRLGGAQPAIPPAIGAFIRALLPIQASFAVLGGPRGMAAACVLLLAWPLAAWAGRRFYAS